MTQRRGLVGALWMAATGLCHADCSIHPPPPGTLTVTSCRAYDPMANPQIRAEVQRRRDNDRHLSEMYRVIGASDTARFIASYTGVILDGALTPAQTPNEPAWPLVPLKDARHHSPPLSGYLYRTPTPAAVCAETAKHPVIPVRFQPNCCDGDTGAPCLM